MECFGVSKPLWQKLGLGLAIAKRNCDFINMGENQINLFISIGLAEQKAKETAKNKAVSNNLENAIIEVIYTNNLPYISYASERY